LGIFFFISNKLRLNLFGFERLLIKKGNYTHGNESMLELNIFNGLFTTSCNKVSGGWKKNKKNFEPLK